MSKKSDRGYFKPYRSYNFVDKDPVIDLVRTAVDDSMQSVNKISLASGVSGSCMHGWFHGKTRRPQFASLNAVLRSMGKEFRIVSYHKK